MPQTNTNNFSNNLVNRQIVYSIYNTLIIASLLIQILVLKLYEIIDGIIFTFYTAVILLYICSTICSIIKSILYIKNKNRLNNDLELSLFQRNSRFFNSKIHQLLNVLLFILALVLGIIFYANGSINKLPIMYTVQIIIISGIPLIMISGLLLSVVLNIGFTIGDICNYINNRDTNINNSINNDEINNSINVNRINRHIITRNTYNINIVVPLPILSEQIKEIETPNEKNCSICLDEESNEKVWLELICNHKYHKTCIERWFLEHTSCPLCRQEVLNLV